MVDDTNKAKQGGQTFGTPGNETARSVSRHALPIHPSPHGS